MTPAANTTIHSEEFAKGAAFAQERAEREARLQRPLFVKPTNGIFTSGFGYRWGALHAGVDLAAPAGTEVRTAAALPIKRQRRRDHSLDIITRS